LAADTDSMTWLLVIAVLAAVVGVLHAIFSDAEALRRDVR
jgi:hypothetical protein